MHKNFFTHSIKPLCLTIGCALALTGSTTYTEFKPPFGTPGAPGMQGMPQPSDADMKQMMQAFDEIEKEIAKLSPDERQEFDRMVNAFGEEMGKMSDDEFQDFISGKMPEDQVMDRFGHIMPEEIQKQADEASDTAATPEPETPEVIVVLFSDENNKADALLKAIIDRIDSFMRKVPTDISFVIPEWIKDKHLTHWKTDDEWRTIEQTIDALRSKLSIIRDDRDKNRKKTYLDALVKNKTLYANLEQMHTVLNREDARIKETTKPYVTSKQMSAAEISAVQKIIDFYAEAITLLEIPKGLDELIATYAEKEKELLKNEELAAKKAGSTLDTRKPTTLVHGGTPAHGGMGGGYPSYGAPSYDAGYAPSASSYYRNPYDTPAASPQPSDTKSDAKKEDDTSISVPLSGGSKDTKTAEPKPGSKEGKESKKPTGKSAKKESNKNIDTVITALKEADAGIKTLYDNLPGNDEPGEKLKTYIQTNTPATDDVDKTLTTNVQTVLSHMSKAGDLMPQIDQEQLKKRMASTSKGSFKHMSIFQKEVANLVSNSANANAAYDRHIRTPAQDVIKTLANDPFDINLLATTLKNNRGKNITNEERTAITGLIQEINDAQKPEDQQTLSTKLYTTVFGMSVTKLPDIANGIQEIKKILP